MNSGSRSDSRQLLSSKTLFDAVRATCFSAQLLRSRERLLRERYKEPIAHTVTGAASFDGGVCMVNTFLSYSEPTGRIVGIELGKVP